MQELEAVKIGKTFDEMFVIMNRNTEDLEKIFSYIKKSKNIVD